MPADCGGRSRLCNVALYVRCPVMDAGERHCSRERGTGSRPCTRKLRHCSLLVCSCQNLHERRQFSAAAHVYPGAALISPSRGLWSIRGDVVAGQEVGCEVGRPGKQAGFQQTNGRFVSSYFDRHSVDAQRRICISGRRAGHLCWPYAPCCQNLRVTISLVFVWKRSAANREGPSPTGYGRSSRYQGLIAECG